MAPPMATQRVTPTTPLVLRNRRSVGQFKVCTLCGALNVRENDECFVCRWSGAFDHDPLAVRVGINEIVRECPELMEVVREPGRRRLFGNLYGRLRGVWYRIVLGLTRCRGVDTRA